MSKTIIISEDIGNQIKHLIFENRESKNINLARKYCISKGYSQEQAQNIIDGIRHDIPNSRIAACKFLSGITRMFIDKQFTDANIIMQFNKTLRYIGSNAHVDEYDYNLNNLSANDLIKRFSGVITNDIAREKELSASRTYTQNNEYNIVKVPNFEVSSQYGDYTSWCVTQDEGAYNSYTNNGLGLFYFCLKNGFENEPQQPGEGCPLDSYGLSMIAVSVNEDGSPNTITCRWNHENGGNDNIMTPQQLEQIIGRGFYQTFIPYTEEELANKRKVIISEAISEFRDRYCGWHSITADDVDLVPLFDTDVDEYDDEEEGGYIDLDSVYNDGLKYFAFRYENDDMNKPKYIICDNDGELLIEDLYDDVDYRNGIIFLNKNNKTTVMSCTYGTPRVITDKWYNKVMQTRSTCYVVVMNENKLFNIVYTINGKEILDEWVKACEVYEFDRDVFAIILTEAGFNIAIIYESAYRIVFDRPKFEISICARQFIKVQDTQNSRENRQPFEIYAFNLQKFPYLVYSCDGFYGDYYRVTTDKGYAFFNPNTVNGFEIYDVVPYELVNNGEASSKYPRNPYGNKKVSETTNKNRIIIINEDIAGELKDLLTMTQFKFKANIKKFLAALLEDPTGAEPDMIFTQNGLDKNKLIKALVDNKVITKKMTIDDHDAEGNPHTAKMIVKYSVPKERFNEKLDALYDILFPDVEGKINENLFEHDPMCDSLRIAKASPLTMGFINQAGNPRYGMGKYLDDAVEIYNKKIEDNKIDEEGAAGGGATSCSGVDGNGFGSGEFVQPLFGGISVRKKKKDKKSVGGNPYTLNESQESKSIDAAKRLFMQRTGKSAEEADKFIRVDLRNDLPVLRDRNAAKFILGVTRMFLDRQLTDASTIQNLNKTLKLLTQGHFNEYDRNLNGMSAQDIISRFATAMKQMDDQEREELGNMQFTENGDYQIVRIDNFEQSSQYGQYTSWCVTHNENMFNSYTSNGLGQFYFCLRNGFENEPEQVGEGCPLDSYGLSMIAVSVDENGRLNTCTCRWNHDNGGNDNIMDAKQISQVIGRNFFEVFKPNGKWQEIVGNAINRLRNGESPEDVFSIVGSFFEGLAIVRLNGKANWLRQDNGQLFSDKWYDNCSTFKEGLAWVKLNGKWNWVRQDNGQLFSDKWYDECFSFSKGLAKVKLNGKGWNWVRQGNGQLLCNQWYHECGDFNEGLAWVRLNGKCNWVRQDNGQLFSDKWFDWCRDFYGGFAAARLNGKWYDMRKDGVLCDNNTQQPIQQQPGLNEVVNNIVRSILSEAVTGDDGRKSSAVYAYAKNTNGEWCILAAKRNKNWDDEGGKMNPPMGHRHKYESPEDGAVRECEEESGIKFDKKDLVLASKEDWGTNFKIYLPGKTSDYKPGEGDEENTKFKWIPVSEIDNYDWAWSCGAFAKRFKPKK